MADTKVLKECRKKFDELKANCAAMHVEIKDNDKEAGKALRTFNNLMRDMTARIQVLKNEGHDYPTLKSYLGDKEVRQIHMVADHQLKELGAPAGLSPGSRKKLDGALKDYKALQAAIAAAIKEEKGKATKRVDGSRVEQGDKLLPELDKLQREVDKFDREKEGLRGLGNTDGAHDSADVEDFRKGLPKAIARIKAAPNKDGKGFKESGWDEDKIAGRFKQMQKYDQFIRKVCANLRLDKQMDKDKRDAWVAEGKKALALADKLGQQHKKLLTNKELVKKLLDDPKNKPMYKHVKAIVELNEDMKELFEKASGISLAKVAAAEKAEGEAAKKEKTG